MFEVVSTNGDTHLGGEDFDNRVMEHFIKIFKSKTGKDMSKDKRAVQKLRREAEKAKRTLSTEFSARIEINSLFENQDFSETFTRSRFEELNIDLFKNTLIPVKKVLQDASLKKSDIDEIILVGGSTRIPKVQQLVKEFFDEKEPNKGINPDEAVAFGAAVQAGILSGEDAGGNVVIVDVNPLTLGIESVGGMMTSLIPRNSMIPLKRSQTFTTVADFQSTITFQVYEGERSMTKDNHLLGKFDLTGIPPVSRGVPQIEVTFEIDSNSILTVSAEDKGTGNKNNIVINNSHKRLSPDEIKRMIKDAEKYADMDRKLKDIAEAKNDLESYVYSLRNQMNENQKLSQKLNSNEKKTIMNAIEAKIKWIDSNPKAKAEDFNNQKKELEDIANPILTRLYKGSDDSNRSSSSTGTGDSSSRKKYGTAPDAPDADPTVSSTTSSGNGQSTSFSRKSDTSPEAGPGYKDEF